MRAKAWSVRDVTVVVEGMEYGGQYCYCRNGDLIVYYGGTVCSRMPYSEDIVAATVAREAIRTEIQRRLREDALSFEPSEASSLGTANG